jgi:electron transfer flavoprotein beta subunit
LTFVIHYFPLSKMPYHSIVLAKQVPDTTDITPKAMKADGTLNRSALPAVFNKDDLHALEMALSIKEKYGGTVTVITMGPSAAAGILREALYRGADRAILLTDRRFAAADTLATSYTLSAAVNKIKTFDLIFCGREASDGNTAQVGPQVAEKLGIPQVTYVEEIYTMGDGIMEARRLSDDGCEKVRATLPLLITVMPDSNEPRPPAARRLLRFKKALTPGEVKLQTETEGASDQTLESCCRSLKEKGLLIEEWNGDDLAIDPSHCGRAGSPTWVKKIERVVLTGGDHKSYPPTDEGVQRLMQELIEEHTFG